VGAARLPRNNGKSTVRIYTPGLILFQIDDLTNMANWLPIQSISTHPGDIMSLSMGSTRDGNMDSGYAYLILGKLLCFYQYNRMDKKEMRPLANNNWKLVLDTEPSNLSLINQMFEAVAAMDVTYQDGKKQERIGRGVTKERSARLQEISVRATTIM
jgi:hypothetical protein